MNKEELQPDPENIDRNASFASADRLTFQGKPIHVCDIHRQFAAQAMGNQMLCGSQRITKEGMYPGMYMDVAVMLWLCSVGKEEVIEAMENPAQGRRNALDWAESVGLSFGSSVFSEAFDVFGDIIVKIQQAQFKVEEKNAEGEGPKM